MTSVFSVVLYFICLVIYGLINSIIDEYCIQRVSKICTQLFKSLYEAKHLSQTVNSCEARRLDPFAGSEDKISYFIVGYRIIIRDILY